MCAFATKVVLWEGNKHSLPVGIYNLSTAILVTAILVTAMLVTAMLCQVKNIVFITRMLKCQCSTNQDSFLLVLSWAVIAKVILVSKKLFCVPFIILWNIFSIYTLSERSLIVVTKFTQHFLMAVYVFYKPKIYLQQYRIVCNCDWWLPWLHKAVGRRRIFDAFSCPPRLLIFLNWRVFASSAINRLIHIRLIMLQIGCKKKLREYGLHINKYNNS